MKKRVLIIDDEPGFTRLLKLNLHHTGRYVAETVNDPARALAVAAAFHPDLILLDVMMPAMDGGDVAAQLHAVPMLQAVPIVFLTAAVKKSEIQSHRGLIGGSPFVAKPADLQELMDCIEQQFNPQRPAWRSSEGQGRIRSALNRGRIPVT